MVRNDYEVWLWKAIRDSWKFLEVKLTLFVDNDRKIKFWKDKWDDESSLEKSFLALFSIAVDKDSWIVEMWEWVGEGAGRVLVFTNNSMIRNWKEWRFFFRRLLKGEKDKLS